MPIKKERRRITLRLTDEERKLLRVAGAIKNEGYQVFMRRVALETASHIVNGIFSNKVEIREPTMRKVTLPDD